MDLPLNRDQSHAMARWLKDNFRAQIETALADTPFTLDIACAIVCQETGIFLLPFTKKLSVADALARCVFDASGDADGTSRTAFPSNTAAFRARFGDAFTEMLIDEANKMRAVRGLNPKPWVYKGYGLFQYDLQHVKVDEAFFRQKLWHDFDECLRRLVSVLMDKFRIEQDVMESIRAYNGRGKRAEKYRAHVAQFMVFCAEVP